MTKNFTMNGSKFNIAIFASGTGTNALKIIERFADDKKVAVSLVVTNNSKAGVINFAKEFNIPVLLVSKEHLKSEDLIKDLGNYAIDLIVLAGFLWKIPSSLIAAYSESIINIHPALLPAYGGKGMYGKYVHEAVILNNEIASGISIHLADEVYDNGKLLFQASCNVEKEDTADSLSQKIHTLEHKYFPNVIDAYIKFLLKKELISK